MENEKQFHRRSAVLLGIFALCLLAFAGLLYHAQVVRHQDYLSKSATQVTHTETIETSRGVITGMGSSSVSTESDQPRAFRYFSNRVRLVTPAAAVV